MFQQDRTLSMASVGLYLDDVPIDIPVGAQLDIPSFDLQRVEVLRGPQGTLFGAGAEAGAVRYVSQNPDLSRFEGTAEAAFTSTAGGDLGYATRVAAGIPIIQDQLAVRLVATQTGDQGYIANLADNDKHSNGYRATTARLVALWQPERGAALAIPRQLPVRAPERPRQCIRRGHGELLDLLDRRQLRRRHLHRVE